MPKGFVVDGIIGEPASHHDNLMAVFAYTVSHLFPEPLDASAVAVNELVVQKDGGLELRGNREPDKGGKLLPCAGRAPR